MFAATSVSHCLCSVTMASKMSSYVLLSILVGYLAGGDGHFDEPRIVVIFLCYMRMRFYLMSHSVIIWISIFCFNFFVSH